MIVDPQYGFHRVDPIPSQEEVEKYYMDEFYSSNYKQFNDSSLDVQEEEQVFFREQYNHIWELCLNIKGQDKIKSVFDIGFGFAQALLYFEQLGLQVSGIEPSKAGVDYAEKKGLSVFHTGIENFGVVGDKRFDVVLLLNVLEHLREPEKTLREIKSKLLAKGGLLVIDVPNEYNDFQLVANEHYKLNNWWLCPPNHINYFSGSTLQNLLEGTGYNVEHKEASFPLELFLLFGEVYVGDAKLGKNCHNKRVEFERLMKKYGKSEKLLNFYKSLAELNLGRQVLTVSRSI